MRERIKPERTPVLKASAILLAVALLFPAPTRAEEPPTPKGQWLFDHAANYSLRIATPAPADVEYLLIWLEAATRVSPELADAYAWRADLLTAIGKEDAALAAFEAYVAHAPKDLPAALRLVDWKLRRAQTAEQRITLCGEMLKTFDSPVPELTSDLHRRLAELHAARGETDLAKEHARQALAAFPGNIPALTVLAQLEGRLDQPATRLELLLEEVKANPASVELRLGVARLLDRFALGDAAQEWYDLAMAARRLAAPDASVADILFEKAWSRFYADQPQACFDLCTKLLVAEPGNLAAEMLLIRAVRKLGPRELVERHLTALAKRVRELEASATQSGDVETLLRLAEFYLDLEPDPQRALDFAQRAARTNAEAARAFFGRALVELKKYAEAVPVLEPLARRDPRAALALAHAQIALDNLDAARVTLHAARRLRYTGPTSEAIVALLHEMHETPAPAPDRATLQAVLGRFDRRPLSFPAEATRLVRFEVLLDRPSYAFNQPIRAHLVLENNAPYPVTLGANRMLAARVAVNLRDAVRETEALPDYLLIPFDQRLVLPAGTRFEVTRRLDTAPARMLLLHEPQHERRFTFSFTLDPPAVTGGMGPASPAGFDEVTREIIRQPVDATRKGLEQLTARLTRGAEVQKLRALETVLALILERRESLRDKPHTYAAIRIDAKALTNQIIAALNDPAPIVRARALWALAYLPLKEPAIAAAAPRLADPDSLVRLLAVEMFAKHQGLLFLPVLKSLAHDPDQLVARLANLYQQQLETPSNQ